jgi:hypothetical protein
LQIWDKDSYTGSFDSINFYLVTLGNSGVQKVDYGKEAGILPERQVSLPIARDYQGYPHFVSLFGMWGSP